MSYVAALHLGVIIIHTESVPKSEGYEQQYGGTAEVRSAQGQFCMYRSRECVVIGGGGSQWSMRMDRGAFSHSASCLHCLSQEHP